MIQAKRGATDVFMLRHERHKSINLKFYFFPLKFRKIKNFNLFNLNSFIVNK